MRSSRQDRGRRRDPGAPSRRRWRWPVRLLLAGLALVALLRLPLVRDLPRRLLEAGLAQAVQGEVALGALRLRGYPTVELVDLRIEKAAILPWLRDARFPELDAEVRLRSLLGGRVERLVVEAGRVELDARCDLALRLPEVAEGLELGALAVSGVEIGVHFAGRRVAALAEAEVRPGPAVGGPPWTGSWRLEAEDAELESLVVLLAGEAAPACSADASDRRLEARRLLIEGELLAAEPGSSGGLLRATAQAGELAVELGERSLLVPEPRADLDWRLASPGRIDAGFELGALGRGRLEAELDGDSGMFRTLDGEIRELDLGMLVPFVVAGVVAAEGRADVQLRLGEDGAGSWQGRATLASIDLRLETGRGRLAGLELETSGGLEPDGRSASVRIEAFAAHGSLVTPAGRTIEAVDIAMRGQGEARLTPGGPPLELGSVSAELEARLDPWGELEASLQLDGADAEEPLQGTWVWHGADLAVLRHGLELAAAPTSWEVRGRAAGAGGFAGSVREPAVWGEISLDGLATDFADGAAAYRTETASLGLRRQAGGAVAVRFGSGGEIALGELPSMPVRLELTGRVLDGVVEIEGGALTLGADGALGEIAATAHGRPGSSWRGTLRAAGADVSAWWDLLAVDATSALAPSGRLSADLDWGLEAEGRWSATGGLTLADGALASADGSRVISPLAWSWTVEADGDAEALGAHLLGEIGGFQMLWGAAFADYGGVGLPVVLDLGARRSGGPGAPWRYDADATVDLGSGARLRGHAQVPGDAGDVLAYRLDAHIEELAPIVEELLRQPFAGGGGALERLSGAGTVEAWLEGRWREGGGEGRGSVHVQAVDLELGEELAVESLALDLPLDLAWSLSGREGEPGGLALEGPVRSGRVRFVRLRAAGIEVPTTVANLEVEGETVRLVDRLSVPVLGGSVLLRDLRLSAGFGDESRGARLESGVELDDLDLAQITETFGLFPLEGRVTGGFPHVVVMRGEMQTLGSGQLAFFDGRAILDQVAVTELFSAFPRVAFDARFENLDLGQLTRTLEFGEITGRVHGELRAVEIVAGVPVRFLGRFESAPSPGVPQRVSIEAANNLALLGTGTSGGLGGGLLTRLFDRFPYVGLGVELALSRDRFQLRGLLERGDKELFLKGRWPLRLDVVNVRPGATVSFKTMMSRIRNLEIGRPQEEQR